ncbi:MAG: DUF2254 domain-containing protein, partial [Ilumatobacter sp.]
MLRLQAWNERIRESLWFWPVLTGIGSAIAAWALARVGSSEGTLVGRLLASPEPDEVRPILVTLLGAIVAAESILSSLTIVTLQTASTQFSPRLLRNFLRDRTTQAVLALFVGTSGFLTTLIIEADDTTADLAVTVSVALVFAVVVVIAWFFGHVSQSLRVESMMHTATDEARDAVDRLERWLATGRPAHDATTPVPATSTAVLATRSGYVQQVDTAALLHVAAEHGITLRLVPQLGQPVTEGAPLAWWWIEPSRTSTPPPSSNAVARRVVANVGIGFERTERHDVGLGLRQLVDMSIKAMSPAVNDPYTAMQAVDHLGSILVRLGRLPLGDHVWSNDDAAAVLILPVATYGEFASLACDQLRRYGAREPAVMHRMMAMLRDVAS